jgi:hypothetical protein
MGQFIPFLQVKDYKYQRAQSRAGINGHKIRIFNIFRNSKIYKFLHSFFLAPSKEKLERILIEKSDKAFILSQIFKRETLGDFTCGHYKSHQIKTLNARRVFCNHSSSLLYGWGN